MNTRLDGCKVLVTGGAVRIGAAICRRFAAEGARILIHYRSSKDQAEALCAELGGEKAGHSVCFCDLTDPAAAAEMVRSPDPDILINSAASYARKTFCMETPEDLQKQYLTNFAAPLAMIRTLAQLRKEKADGKESVAVNLLDAGIAAADPVSFSYGLSKKSLADATRAAALQAAPYVRVNAVAPGHVLPPPHLAARNMAETSEKLPLRRPVSLDDLTDTVLFAACNRSMTGSVLYVDCGQSLCGFYSQQQ